MAHLTSCSEAPILVARICSIVDSKIDSDIGAIGNYRSVPLIRPPILYTTSSPKRGGSVFSRTQLVSIIRPLKKFCYVYDTHVHSYKSTNDR